jgi:hypothetical protein
MRCYKCKRTLTARAPVWRTYYPKHHGPREVTRVLWGWYRETTIEPEGYDPVFGSICGKCVGRGLRKRERQPFSDWYVVRCPVCDRPVHVNNDWSLWCSPICSYQCRNRLHPHPRRPKATVACAYCRAKFVQSRTDARFCSAKCRVYARRSAQRAGTLTAT